MTDGTQRPAGLLTRSAVARYVERPAIGYATRPSLAICGNKLVFDLLMLILLIAAFSGAAAYVLVCLDLTRNGQPPERAK
jgi:hypothetical protein